MTTRILSIVSFLAAVLSLSGCEDYRSADENRPFGIACEFLSSSADGSAELLLTLSDACTDAAYSVTVTVDGGRFDSFEIGGVARPVGDSFFFKADGSALIRLVGLPSGEHRVAVTVSRWYHSANASLTVLI